MPPTAVSCSSNPKIRASVLEASENPLSVVEYREPVLDLPTTAVTAIPYRGLLPLEWSPSTGCSASPAPCAAKVVGQIGGGRRAAVLRPAHRSSGSDP